MALPAGALTATVTVGGSVGIAGTSAVVSDFTVALDLPAAGRQSPGLVWAATGEAVNSFAETGVAGAITVLADQPGVLASSTVNGSPALVEVRGWPLVARWRVTSGGDSRWHTRRLAAPTAGTNVFTAAGATNANLALRAAGTGIASLQGSGGANIVAADTTGGVSRVGFFGVTPLIRQTVADCVVAADGTSAGTQLNALLARLRLFGLLT